MSPQSYVLVADDDPLMLKSLQIILRGAGFRVVTVPDGVTALEQIRNERPRLAILDVMMARMNGLELCRTLKGDEDLRDVKIFCDRPSHAARAASRAAMRRRSLHNSRSRQRNWCARPAGFAATEAAATPPLTELATTESAIARRLARGHDGARWHALISLTLFIDPDGSARCK